MVAGYFGSKRNLKKMIKKIIKYVRRNSSITAVGTKNQSDREAWLERTLQKIPAGSRILDAGAGEQKYKQFCTHLDYVAQDFAKYDGKGDGRGLQTEFWEQTKLDIVSDITAIPESDASFDVIMCIEVFEHLPEPIKAIQEFSRLLKPRGYLILTAPFCSLTHFAPYHFYTGFNRYFYEMHLPANGFEIVELQVNGNFFEYLAQEIRRIPWAADHCTEGSKCTRFESLAMKVCLTMLERFSTNDTDSSKLLHFGYHVLCEKND